MLLAFQKITLISDKTFNGLLFVSSWQLQKQDFSKIPIFLIFVEPPKNYSITSIAIISCSLKENSFAADVYLWKIWKFVCYFLCRLFGQTKSSLSWFWKKNWTPPFALIEKTNLSGLIIHCKLSRCFEIVFDACNLFLISKLSNFKLCFPFSSFFSNRLNRSWKKGIRFNAAKHANIIMKMRI